jgi:nucleoside-diphosphate-sugar epimerase
MSSDVPPSEPVVLVTGASGFVGTALCGVLAQAGYRVRRALRTAALASPDDVVVGDINEHTVWHDALRGAKFVVHLAARTHAIDKRRADVAAEYQRINVAGTRQLAEAAAYAGIGRFVFLSSVKVNGEVTGEHRFCETDPPRPEDSYGETKLEAEDFLKTLASRAPMEIVIVRSPLVYGPGVKGNFERLMRYVASGVPLPLGSIRNRRSLIYVGNLADAILACMERPQAAGRTYLVSDGEDMSTPELVGALAQALRLKPRVLSCPVRLLQAVANHTGKSAEIARLTHSLAIDTTRIRHELGWTPPYSAAYGLRETARWYYAHVNGKARAE